MSIFTISKDIEIDYGHRVPDHRSKCFSPHGHRGKITAHCSTEQLISSGEQTGMVLDFGFLKTILTHKVHDILDHAFIYYADDSYYKQFIKSDADKLIKLGEFSTCTSQHGFKIVVIRAVPTAENLAKLIFLSIEHDVFIMSEQNARLVAIDFWETPTSMATYRLE